MSRDAHATSKPCCGFSDLHCNERRGRRVYNPREEASLGLDVREKIPPLPPRKRGGARLVFCAASGTKRMSLEDPEPQRGDRL